MSEFTGDDPAPRSPDWTALSGAAATAGLHLIMQAQGPSPLLIVGACLFWSCFVFFRTWQDRAALRRWGFRADNLHQAAVFPALIFVVTAIGFAWYAHRQGTLGFSAHLLLILLIYPAWGLVQEFLVLAVVVGNLELMPSLRRRRGLLVLLVAAVFGLIHGLDLRVVSGSFFLELTCIPLYFKYRNLWPLGVLHGWLGALFYFWIEGRDMWVENFQTHLP
jgi:hypothetical protein